MKTIKQLLFSNTLFIVMVFIFHTSADDHKKQSPVKALEKSSIDSFNLSSGSKELITVSKKDEAPTMKKVGPRSLIEGEKKLIPQSTASVIKMNTEVAESVHKPPFSKENSVSSKPLKKSVPRTIVVSNHITQDMITYKKHWTGNYTPSKFILMVNGQEVKQDAATPIQVTGDKLCMSFDYEFKVFGKVQRAGGRKLEYVVPPDVEKISSTFSWDEPTNLVLNKGLLVASVDNSY